MAIEAPSAAEIFPHVRIVMGMVVGLGMTRLLSGVARIVQHPRRTPVYAVHLGWTLSVLLMLVHFWWWEFGLYHIGNWTFGIYLFLISYSILLFQLCAFLFPESMADYSGYEDYFLSKRIWFFGILASTYFFDYADTMLKGRQHLESFGTEYLVRLPVFVALCLAAMATRNRTFHAILVIGTIVYQISFILRLFDTLS
ncbi:MAG: hypothetical protein ACTHJY_21820 [Rhizobiaceae bacterium]